MKKLVEIPFNHELIGQEGIVVKKNESEVEVFISKKRLQSHHSWPIMTINTFGTFTSYPLNGIIETSKLTMHQEVEVKEPRVVYVNMYDNNHHYAYPTKEDAEKNKGIACVETVKFIEVIEEEGE